MEKLAQDLNLDQIAHEKKEQLRQRLQERYQSARSALQLFSPIRPSPPVAADDQFAEPLVRAVGIDFFISIKFHMGESNYVVMSSRFDKSAMEEDFFGNIKLLTNRG
jgi:hypothetical protein